MFVESASNSSSQSSEGGVARPRGITRGDRRLGGRLLTESTQDIANTYNNNSQNNGQQLRRVSKFVPVADVLDDGQNHEAGLLIGIRTGLFCLFFYFLFKKLGSSDNCFVIITDR
jgi:hypothetical protein